jgi:hypothetical protein
MKFDAGKRGMAYGVFTRSVFFAIIVSVEKIIAKNVCTINI